MVYLSLSYFFFLWNQNKNVCLLSRCSRVWLFAAHGLPRLICPGDSLGNNTDWSRLPFPSPGDLSHQRSNSCLLHLLHWQVGSLPLVPPGCFRVMLCLLVHSSPTLCDRMDYSPPGSFVHGILQARILEWVAVPSSRDLANPRIEPRSPALQVDSLPSEPLGKTKNAGVGILSLLQGIFLTQEWNRGLLLC